MEAERATVLIITAQFAFTTEFLNGPEPLLMTYSDRVLVVTRTANSLLVPVELGRVSFAASTAASCLNLWAIGLQTEFVEPITH